MWGQRKRERCNLGVPSSDPFCIFFKILLQAWSGPEGSRKLRFPIVMTKAQDGGKGHLLFPVCLGNANYIVTLTSHSCWDVWQCRLRLYVSSAIEFHSMVQNFILNIYNLNYMCTISSHH